MSDQDNKIWFRYTPNGHMRGTFQFFFGTDRPDCEWKAWTLPSTDSFLEQLSLEDYDGYRQLLDGLLHEQLILAFELGEDKGRGSGKFAGGLEVTQRIVDALSADES